MSLKHLGVDGPQDPLQQYGIDKGWLISAVNSVSDGDYALVDSGATNALRPAAPQELEKATRIKVDLASGETYLHINEQGTLLSTRQCQVILPAGYLVHLGFAITWRKTKLATGRGCTQPENSEIHHQKVSLFAKSCTFRLFGQKFKKSHFSTFRAIFSLFDFSGKNSKSRTFRKKLQISTFRAKVQKKKLPFSQKFALFDSSGNFLTFRLFGQKFKKSHFSQKFALFDVSGSFLTFRLFGQKFKKSHFSQKVTLFDFRGNFLTFRVFEQKFNKSHFSQKVAPFDIYLSPFPARNIGYGWFWDMPPTVSIYPPRQPQI